MWWSSEIYKNSVKILKQNWFFFFIVDLSQSGINVISFTQVDTLTDFDDSPSSDNVSVSMEWFPVYENTFIYNIDDKKNYVKARSPAQSNLILKVGVLW